MAKMWKKAPSPCVDVCKYKDAGHCLGCRMTKPEKKRFKKLGKGEKKAFFLVLRERLEAVDRYGYWARMYRRRCEKKQRPCPLDRLEEGRPRAGEAA